MAETTGILAHPPADEDELTDAEIIDMYRRPDVYGWGCEDERGWPHPDDTHADPRRYTDDELLTMNEAATEACASCCIMHLDYRYPIAPAGVWNIHVNGAMDALNEATRRHTGRDAFDGEAHWRYHATAAELRRVWDDWPHARWYFETDTAYDIEVIGA